MHLVEYSILGYLAVNSFRAISKGQVIVIIISCLGFACFDELWQSLIPGRFSSGLDIIADGIGITVGAIFGSLLIINKWMIIYFLPYYCNNQLDTHLDYIKNG